MGRGKTEQRWVTTRADTSSGLSLFSGVLLVTLWLAQILHYGLYVCIAQKLMCRSCHITEWGLGR